VNLVIFKKQMGGGLDGGVSTVLYMKNCSVSRNIAMKVE
jgi:hypothetical protein